MSATESYRFHQFLLRPAGAIATDALLARQWTAADPWHASTTDPRFWLRQDFDCDSYILFDKDGPVFFWQGILIPSMEGSPRRMEMHIQFPPSPEDRAERYRMKQRIRAGLLVGLQWLTGMLFTVGVEEVYFDSPNPKLAEFATHDLRFVQDGQRLTKRLTPPPGARKPLERQM